MNNLNEALIKKKSTSPNIETSVLDRSQSGQKMEIYINQS